jgi:uncharacterized protein (DUF4213/DUF364 family)
MSELNSGDPQSDAEKPLSPEQANLVAKVRRLMLVSGFATLLGIAVVIGVIGYRVFRSDGSTKDVTALLPKGARIVQTAVAGDYIVVTLDIGGTTEIRSFEAKSLRPVGRLRFATEP